MKFAFIKLFLISSILIFNNIESNDITDKLNNKQIEKQRNQYKNKNNKKVENRNNQYNKKDYNSSLNNENNNISKVTQNNIKNIKQIENQYNNIGNPTKYNTQLNNVNNNNIKKYDDQLKKFFEKLELFNAIFVQQSKNIQDKFYKEKCDGTIDIRRNDTNPQMKILYINGPIQEIVMQGRFISILNRKTQKRKSYSILTTPLYALLSGNMKLSELKPNISVNGTNINVYIKSDKQNITLVFSTKQIKNEFKIDQLIAWTVNDGRTIVNVTFSKQSYNIINNRSN